MKNAFLRAASCGFFMLFSTNIAADKGTVVEEDGVQFFQYERQQGIISFTLGAEPVDSFLKAKLHCENLGGKKKWRLPRYLEGITITYLLVAPQLKHEFLGLPTHFNERNNWAYWMDDKLLQAAGDQVFILTGPEAQGKLYSLKLIQQRLRLNLTPKIQPFCVPAYLNLELSFPAKL